MKGNHNLLMIPAVVIGAFLPALFGGSGAVYSAFVLIAIFSVMSYGLDLILSDLGEVSLAHPVFFATGAYTTAVLAARYDVGPFGTLAATIVVALGAAVVVGLITLRLREFVFSLVTYSVLVVALTLAQNWRFLGGSDGIAGIPALVIDVAGFRWEAAGDQQLWPVAYGLLLVVLYVVSAFRRSTLGAAAMMVHLNQKLAIMSGVDPQRARLYVFLISAPITASAGWLYAYQRAYISADVLSPYFLLLMLTAVVVVGKRKLLAPLLGVTLILLQEKFLSLGGYVDSIILGSVLVLTLSFMPGGLMGGISSLRRRFASRPPIVPAKRGNDINRSISCP